MKRTPDVDSIARSLAYFAHLGKRMPPSWDGAGITIPFVVPEGQVGWVLPGKGLVVDSDLKSVGITRPIPGVAERGTISRFWDKLKDKRLVVDIALALASGLFSPGFVFGTIQKYDDILQNYASGTYSDWEIVKNSVTGTLGQWSTIMRATGTPAAITYTAIPGGSAFDQTSAGSFASGLASPIGGRRGYLIQVGFQSGTTAINGMLLIDLLVAVGSISATVSTAQTVNSTALTRYTSGAGVQMIFDVTTALGSTAQNLTVSYTNQAGTAGQSTGAQTLTPSVVAAKLQPALMPPFTQLASGDFGVRSVQTATCSAANTAGALALNLFYPLAFIGGIGSTAYLERDLCSTMDNIVELVKTSTPSFGCLGAYILLGGATTSIVDFHFKVVQG